MRELFINGLPCDIEDKTAIGISFQSGDISEPCKNKLSITNSFALPLTAKNIRNIQFSNNPMSNSKITYDKLVIDYYDSCIPLIQNSLAFIQSINEKINITVVKGSDFVETLKYNTIQSWLINDIGIEITGGSGFIGDVYYSGATAESELYDDLMGVFAPPSTAIEFIKPITVLKDSYNQGTFYKNFGIKLQSIFDFIELYGVRGSATALKYKITFNGTTSQNSDFENFVMPFPFLSMEEKPQSSGNWGMVLNDYDNLGTGVFSLNWLGQKTLLDLLKAICNLFNAILDIDDKNQTAKITTFNKIAESNTILNWSNKIVYQQSKNTKPIEFNLSGWAQKTILNYKYDDGVSTSGGMVEVLCGNKNIEAEKKTEIPIFIPRAITNPNNDIFYLSGTTNTEANPLFTQKGIEELTLFKITGLTNGSYYGLSNGYIYQVLPINFSSNYSSIRSILEFPKIHKLQLNLNILDIYNFTPENLVRVDSLGGIFYVNKIDGFNSKAKVGTNVELIKIR